MELNARELAESTVLDTDVCIIGAGPAGLTIAGELAGGALDVILLESGGDGVEQSILALNDGDVVGDDYAGLLATRHRQLGGTSGLWNTLAEGAIGAKYVPLDPVDLEERPAVAYSGWPIEYAELRGYYDRAQRLCGVGPLEYDATHWTRSDRPLLPLDGRHLVTRVYQLGARTELIARSIARVTAAPNVRICTHATVLRLVTNGAGRKVVRAEVGSPGGPRWSLRAKTFVLAAGAVENARLLLVSGDSPEGLGNRAGWVGRCFMEHPRDRSLHLAPRSPNAYRDWAFYDLHQVSSDRQGSGNATVLFGRLALDEGGVRSGELPNASATLYACLSPALTRLRDKLDAYGVLRPAQRLLPRGGHLWSRHPAPARVFSGFTVLLNLEQSPHPDNRVRLGARRDALGSPLPELHWQWRAADRERLERLRMVVARELEEAGLGRITVDANGPPDPNAHHHAGTTRMHADERRGVLDPHGRVHSLDNLHLSGASAFPTAGFANPVLTIIALAVRLADHLKRTL